MAQSPITKQTEDEKQGKPKQKQPFRIGIIATGLNDDDILAYNEQLIAINTIYRQQVRLVVFGYKNENDRLNMLRNVIYEYVKPVSLVHHYKQLAYLQLNMLFIPLINDEHNATSEDYEKYLEASLFKIPVLAPDIYPYNKLIRNTDNGFIYGNRKNFIPYVQDLFKTKAALIAPCGERAWQDVFDNFNYSAKNIEELSSSFL